MASGLQIQYKKDSRFKGIVLFLLIIVIIGSAGWSAYRYFMTGELPFGVTVGALQANPSLDEDEIPASEIQSHTAKNQEPRYISIPTLDIKNARVFSGGIEPNKVLTAPSNSRDAMWYNKSAKPGQGYGTVLMNGYSNGVKQSGIFAKLKTLSEGDKITIERGDGKMYTYRTESIQSQSLDEVNRDGLKTLLTPIENGTEGLSIITDDGKWIPRIQQFDRRVTVRAVLVD